MEFLMNNLEDSQIYRTGEGGSVMFKIKNNKLQIVTCHHRKEIVNE